MPLLHNIKAKNNIFKKSLIIKTIIIRVDIQGKLLFSFVGGNCNNGSQVGASCVNLNETPANTWRNNGACLSYIDCKQNLNNIKIE